MRPTAYIAEGESTSPRWCVAFAEGCGGTTQVGGPLCPGPIALFGSTKLWWDILAGAQADGRSWYYGDHGYFGRFSYFRCTRNAYQHDGRGEADVNRFRAFEIPVIDWRRTGSHILVCPPDAAFAVLMGFDAAEWLTTTMTALRSHSDRPIKIRERRARDCSLADDLIDAWALVTHMSNAAVEAVLAGIPIFTTGRCAARTMGSSDLSRIENPRTPNDRETWAGVLAANQWTLSEMRAGALWRAIGDT